MVQWETEPVDLDELLTLARRPGPRDSVFDICDTCGHYRMHHHADGEHDDDGCRKAIVAGAAAWPCACDEFIDIPGVRSARHPILGPTT